MLGNEKFNHMWTHEDDEYGGVLENVGPRPCKQTAEIVLMRLAGGEHGGFDVDDVMRGRERGRGLIRRLRKEEAVGC